MTNRCLGVRLHSHRSVCVTVGTCLRSALPVDECFPFRDELPGVPYPGATRCAAVSDVVLGPRSFAYRLLCEGLVAFLCICNFLRRSAAAVLEESFSVLFILPKSLEVAYFLILSLLALFSYLISC